MTQSHSRIGFQLPEQGAPGPDALATHARHMEEWLAALPLGSSHDTARMVYEALQQSNRQHLSWKERFHFLEQLRQPVALVGETLHRRLLDAAVPIPSETLHNAHFLIDLFQEMALGYQAAAEDLRQSWVLLHGNQRLATLLHRILYYLDLALVTHYQTYLPVPPRLWSIIHHVYRFAEAENLHRLTLVDHERESDITRSYLQIQLLALATPHRLHPTELWLVYGALGEWTALAQLAPCGAVTDNPALFSLHMGSDQEPRHVSRGIPEEDPAHCRVLNLEQLQQALKHELESLGAPAGTGAPTGRFATGFTPDLLRRLISAWGAPASRAFPRTGSDEQIRVVVGLNALHKIIIQQLATPTPDTPTAAAGSSTLFTVMPRFSTRVITSEDEKSRDDAWKLFKPQPSRLMQQTSLGTAPADILPTEQSWQICDTGPGGWRLSRSGSDTVHVRVGELLGLRGPDEHFWCVGVVRWIHYDTKHNIEMGVQYLAKHPQPVAIRTHTAGHAADYQRALGISVLTETGQHAQLLVPARLFTAGTPAHLHAHGHDHPIRLNACVENSRGFAQFTFADALRNPQSPPSAGTMTAGPHNQFDALWAEP